ncbi:hypothetical protein [uncultured Enterovirga sp.]|uniref:hypothetical protein n=1 Tax=uncultured Enterovirga sp. TaxID=2026352 RepID=UPI0035CB18BD
MSIRTMAGAGCALLMVTFAGEASAQRSLFGEPTAEPPPAAAAPAAAPTERKARPKPRPRGPVPARSLSVQNDSQNALISLEVSGEGKSARLAKPLKPKGKTTLRLPALKSCTVSVAAGFENSGEAQASDLDICKEKVVRFTDS